MNPNLKSYLKKMSEVAAKRSKMEIIKWYPILASEFYLTEFPKKTFYIATVNDKSKIPILLSHFNQVSPIHEYSFKRVRNKKIENEDQIADILISESDKLKEIPNDLDKYLTDLRQIELPCYNPKTRSQFSLISKEWPISFHFDKEIEILI